MTDILLVLGPHRSGTSSVAGTLAALGASPPKTLLPASDYNPGGYFESKPICNFHDDVLHSAGSAWDDWRPFNPAWYGASGYATYKQQAVELFKAEFCAAPLAILKDPRICRFAPFWIDVLAEMGINPRVLTPVRSPLEAARSLNQRNGFPVTKGLLIWLRHALDAEHSTRSLPRAIFGWNDFLLDWRGVAERIAAETVPMDRRDAGKAPKVAAPADGPYHRLVSHRHENSAAPTDRRSYRVLARRRARRAETGVRS